MLGKIRVGVLGERRDRVLGKGRGYYVKDRKGVLRNGMEGAVLGWETNSLRSVVSLARPRS